MQPLLPQKQIGLTLRQTALRMHLDTVGLRQTALRLCQAAERMHVATG